MNITKNSKYLDEVIATVSKNVIDQLQLEESQESWPRFMDIKTTALYLDKSDTCIRNWIRNGEVPTVQLSTLKGRRRLPVFVDRYALDRLISVKN